MPELRDSNYNDSIRNEGPAGPAVGHYVALVRTGAALEICITGDAIPRHTYAYMSRPTAEA